MLFAAAVFLLAAHDFDAVRLPLSSDYCAAAAVNELGDIGLNCGLNLSVVDQDLNVSELAWHTWRGYLHRRALNNARQAVVDVVSTPSGIFGGSSQYVSFLPGPGAMRVLAGGATNVIGLNNAGRVLLWHNPEGAQVWEDGFRPLQDNGARISAWNDFEQTFAFNESANLAYRLNTRTGEIKSAERRITGNIAVMNARGWVANTMLPDYDNGSRNDSTGDLVLDTFDDNGQLPRSRVIAAGRFNVYYQPLGLNDRGWLLFLSQQNLTTQFYLWDGQTVRNVNQLLPAALQDRQVTNVAGPNNDGVLAVTLAPRADGYSIYDTYRLTPIGLDPFTEILKPESGSELSGHGEYLGCDAQTGDAVLTGWAFDASRPALPPAVELYDGTRLIAAAIAVATPREDGTYGYQVTAPAKIFRDGKDHFLNVRYAGTATAIEQSWGTIQCAATAN